MVLMVVCWRYRMPFDANGCVSTLVNVDCIKWMYFCVNEFQVGVNDSIFSGNEQQKVYVEDLSYFLLELVVLTKIQGTYKWRKWSDGEYQILWEH